MQSKKAHFVLAALLLIIFSIGTAYDACAQKEWQLTSAAHSSPAFSNDPVAPSPLSGSVVADCHCLCHFSFEPSSNISFEVSTPYQSFIATLKESIKEPALVGILRPPISLL
ncbi:MAG: hypothetical protein EPO39_02225 [Candidatus Manganitrophaceae bacterium]|nr:MAG: hypothetical protein EPO39_02225 [Candidatus Manganitrophaceae bacterium]